MRELRIETISDQVSLFMQQFAYTEEYLAERMKISPQVFSDRKKMSNWRFWEIESLKKIFKERGIILIVMT